MLYDYNFSFKLFAFLIVIFLNSHHVKSVSEYSNIRQTDNRVCYVAIYDSTTRSEVRFICTNYTHILHILFRLALDRSSWIYKREHSEIIKLALSASYI